MHITGYRPRTAGVGAVLKDGAFGRMQYEIVYAVWAADKRLFKFGRTTNIKKRFSALTGSSPVKLELYGHIWMPEDTEANVLQYLKGDRSHRDWF